MWPDRAPQWCSSHPPPSKYSVAPWLTASSVGAYALTLFATCVPSWQPFLDSLSRAADVLLLAIVGWVVARLRSTSRDAQWISSVTETNYVLLHQLLGRSVSPPVAPGRRKSSMKGTTSTSLGEPPSTDPENRQD